MMQRAAVLMSVVLTTVGASALGAQDTKLPPAVPKGEARQIVDTAFSAPRRLPPTFAKNGPTIVIDEAHHNFHTATGRYRPFAKLAQADGFRVVAGRQHYPIVFRRSDGTLQKHPITNGRNRAERVDSIESFTGSAFRVTRAPGADIMVLPPETRVMMPVEAWKFSDSTAAVAGEGLLQGAAFNFGRGRVGVFGEAAMFSAQRKGVDQVPMGMNAPAAAQNPQFILNVLHWLVRLYE